MIGARVRKDFQLQLFLSPTQGDASTSTCKLSSVLLRSACTRSIDPTLRATEHYFEWTPDMLLIVWLLRLRLSSKVPQPLEAGYWGMLQGIGWGWAKARLWVAPRVYSWKLATESCMARARALNFADTFRVYRYEVAITFFFKRWRYLEVLKRADMCSDWEKPKEDWGKPHLIETMPTYLPWY